jgi:hypothetical protein
MEEPSNGKIEETRKVELEEESVEVQSVVESANGKLEEIQKVEPQAENKEVVIDDVGEVKAVDESVREIVVDEFPESVDQTYDGGDSGLISSSFDKEEAPNEKSFEGVDSGNLGEEVKEVSDYPFVSFSTDFSEGVEELVKNSIRLEKENEEKVLLSSEKTNGISLEVPNEELKVIEETKLQSSDETSGSAEAAKEIEETTLPTLEEEGRVPEVVPRGIEETKLLASDVSVAEVSKENVNNSLQPLANAPVVDTSYVGEEGNKTEIPESTGNPHIISMSQRTLQPTSWRSCCGLFEVLRRFDR